MRSDPTSASASEASPPQAVALEVAVILPDARPEAWVVALLDRIDAHRGLALRLFLAAADTADLAFARPADPLSRLARFVVHDLVDRPRFPADARRATPLAPARRASARTLPSRAADAAADPALVGADVVLDVGGALSPFAPRARLWSARTELLAARVERALLDRAPLFWLYLWERVPDAGSGDWEPLAAHALPMQSFSVSDLVGAAFRALPAVFVARLGWLAAGRDPRAVEGASLPPQTDTSAATEPIRSERVAALRAAAAIGAHGADRSRHRRERRGAVALGSVALLARQSARRLLGRVAPERWQLAVSTDANADPARVSPVDVLRRPLGGWRAIVPPRGRIWADPHLAREGGRTWLFFEELEHGAGRARIAALELDGEGRPRGSARRVLERPHHLSYPFVFSHGGRHYMLPECAAERRVSLFRTERLPDGWHHLHDLLVDVDLADSTLCRHAGHWWLFTNRFSDRSVDERDELLLFFADTLEGPWTPHRLNPVVTGVDRARMAGPVFEEGGALYRPSQYGAVRYGYGINLARIELLTPEDYRETPLARLVPERRSRWLGCHSFARAAPLTVIDRIVRGR